MLLKSAKETVQAAEEKVERLTGRRDIALEIANEWTPTGLATPEAIPVQPQIVLLPETGRAGHLSAAGLVLAVLGAGAVWCKRRVAA